MASVRNSSMERLHEHGVGSSRRAGACRDESMVGPSRVTEASKELIKRKLDPRHEGLIRPYCLEWKFGKAIACDFYRVNVRLGEIVVFLHLSCFI